MTLKMQRQQIKTAIRQYGQVIFSVFDGNHGFLYTVGNTSLGSPELYLACNKTLVFTVQHMMNGLHHRIKTGHPVRDGQLIDTQEGRVFKARLVSDALELAHFRAKRVCQATAYYRKPVQVIELVSFGHHPGTDCRVADVMSKQRFCAVCGSAKGDESAELLKCGQCRLVYYCSKECQKADWPKHKQGCQVMASGCSCGSQKCQHPNKPSVHGVKTKKTDV